MTAVQFLAGGFGLIQLDGGQSVADITGWQLQCRVMTKAYQSNLTGSDTKNDVGVKQWSGSFDFLVPADQSYDWQEGTILSAVQFHIDDSDSNYIEGDILIEQVAYRDEISANRMIGGTAVFSGQGSYQRFGTLAVGS